MRYLLLFLLAAPLAVAQPADGIADDPHDYSRTTYTAEATFIDAQPREGRVVEMVPDGAIVGVDVCDDGWCPVRYEAGSSAIPDTGYVPRDALTSAPGIPALRTANPDVWTAPARPSPKRPSPAPASSLDQTEAPAPDAAEAAFVGSKRSKVFHRASCSHVARIAAHNLVAYESAADAESKGKRPCQVCHPSDD